jgi:hypothetical protein
MPYDQSQSPRDLQNNNNSREPVLRPAPSFIVIGAQASPTTRTELLHIADKLKLAGAAKRRLEFLRLAPMQARRPEFMKERRAEEPAPQGDIRAGIRRGYIPRTRLCSQNIGCRAAFESRDSWRVGEGLSPRTLLNR